MANDYQLLSTGTGLIAKAQVKAVDKCNNLITIEIGSHWVIHRAEHWGSLGSLYTLKCGFTTVELREASVYSVFGLIAEPKAQARASHFRAVTDIDSGGDHKLKTESLKLAKSFLKRKCSKGFIEAKVNGNWVRVLEFDGRIGFARTKMYNGMDPTGPYLRF